MPTDASPIPFTASPLDRADVLRKDPDAVAALWARDDARVLVLWRGRPLLCEHDGGCVVASLSPSEVGPSPWLSLLLGLEDGAPRFAICLDPAHDPPERFGSHGAFLDLRASAGRMSPADSALAGTARGVSAWHRHHQFCSSCGAPTTPRDAGWKRSCDDCRRDHFPRTDPVVIMLISHGDRLLLGRAPSWPAGMFSCLAGFVEPGETLEAAARREAAEEASIALGGITYVTSQPWPFPSSLMIGLHAQATSPEVQVDQLELAEARWFSRDEVEQLVAGTHPDASAPTAVAVAHHLLRWWLAR